MTPPRLRLVVASLAVASVTGCSLLFDHQEDGDAGKPLRDAATGDADPGADGGPGPVFDAGVDAAIDAGPPTDTDGDGLLDGNDPCPGNVNEVLADDFEGWTPVIDSVWDIPVGSASATADGAAEFLRSDTCWLPEQCERYIVDARVSLVGSNLPNDVGIHGSITTMDGGGIEDKHCGLDTLYTAPRVEMAVKATGQTYSEFTPIDVVPTWFMLRLIVSREDSWCFLDANEPVYLRAPALPAGIFGIWERGGYARFEELSIRTIPSECQEVVAAPPPL